MEKCKHDIVVCLAETEKEATKIIESLTALHPDLTVSSVQNNLDRLLSILPSSTRKKTSEVVQDIMAHQYFLAAYEIKRLIAILDGHDSVESINPWLLADAMYHIGLRQGMLNESKWLFRDDFSGIVRSLLARDDRKSGHEQEDIIRQRLFDDFEEYARGRIAKGYTGSATTLVRTALNLPKFSKLKAATTPEMDNSGGPMDGKITKRALIKVRRLEESARKLLKNASQK